MRIGWISSFPPSTDGLAIYSFKLCNALSKIRNDLEMVIVSTATAKRKAAPDSLRNRKIEVYRVGKAVSFIFPFKVFSVMTTKKVDVIHCQYEYWYYGRGIHAIIFPLLLLYLKVLRRSILVTLHVVIPIYAINSEFLTKHMVGRHFALIKKILFIALIRIIASLSSAIVVHLNVQKEILMKDYHISGEKIFIIPHGADCVKNFSIDKFKAREILCLPREENVLLCFGEIRRGKGLEFAVKAMKEVLKVYPNTTLVMAGEYRPKRSIESAGFLDKLKREINAVGVGDRVIIVNKFIPEEDIPLYFKASDIALLPYTENEIVAASGPLYRAISYGVPIVGTRIERFCDILKHRESAVLVKPADAKELAKGIIFLLSNPILKTRLSNESKKILEQSSWEMVARSTLNLYHIF